MLRPSKVVNQLIAEKTAQLIEDRAQLASLKNQLMSGPNEFVQKAINAMRTTIANGAEDLTDLDVEIKLIEDFEASEAGQLHRVATQNKLVVVDALVDVCMLTASEADRALNLAWHALRKHHAAHAALHDGVAQAYSAVIEGSDFDPHQDQLFLLRSYSTLANSGPALAEWLVESLQGYELNNFIKVEGITLNHNEHLTLSNADGVGLSRMWARLKEVAQRCGVVVPEVGSAAQAPLRQALLAAVTEATKNER